MERAHQTVVATKIYTLAKTNSENEFGHKFMHGRNGFTKEASFGKLFINNKFLHSIGGWFDKRGLQKPKDMQKFSKYETKPTTSSAGQENSLSTTSMAQGQLTQAPKARRVLGEISLAELSATLDFYDEIVENKAREEKFNEPALKKSRYSKNMNKVVVTLEKPEEPENKENETPIFTITEEEEDEHEEDY